MNQKIHGCDTNENTSYNKEIIYFELSGWNMDDGHDGYIEIQYCPYCGRKLDI